MEGLEVPNIEREQIQKEEGLEDTIEEKPERINEIKKGRKAPLVVGIIIGLLIGFVLFSPNMIGLLYDEPESDQQNKTGEPEIPIYEYTMFESWDTATYRNENLSVLITVEYDYKSISMNIFLYNIYYIAYANEVRIVDSKYTPNQLLGAVLQNSVNLTDNQVKWFYFTCKNILPIRHYREYYWKGYVNDEIEVSIWYHGAEDWNASWTYNNKEEIIFNKTRSVLFSNIEKQESKMSNIQYEWFKFMCKDEINK